MIKLILLLNLLNLIITNDINIQQQQQLQQNIVLKDGSICLKCPLVNNNDDTAIVRYWNGQLNSEKIFLCRKQIEFDYKNKNNKLIYSCKNNELCLYHYKSTYPRLFECSVDNGIATVNVSYIVQAQYISLIPEADYLNIEGSKLTLKENTLLNLTCEISETNPKSEVKLLVGDREIPNRGIVMKPFDDDRKVVYSYSLNVGRELQKKQIICDSRIIGIDDDIAKKWQMKVQLDKKFTLDVQYIPKCGNNNFEYHTGYNQTIIMECKVSDANPNVLSYQLNGPTETTLIEPMFENERHTGRFKVTPREKKDLGKYFCYPRNSAGSTTCSMILILGGYPNPPYDCSIKYDRSSNKTRGQIDCKTGFNQNGTKLEFNVFERLIDGQLKHAGSVNVYEEKAASSVGYLTKELNENEYYEFVVIQTNNYGNSEPVVLTIGSKAPEKSSFSISKNTLIGIIAGGLGGLILICLCCCCTSSFCSSVSENKSNNCLAKYCPCCYRDSNNHEQNTSTYKKGPYTEDLMHSYMEDDTFKEESKYIPSDNGLIYTPMLTKPLKISDNNIDKDKDNDIDNDNDRKYSTINNNKVQYSHFQHSHNNSLVNSFRNELNHKLQKQRSEVDSKLNSNEEEIQKLNTNSNNNDEIKINQQNTHQPSYETSSSSSSTSNNDLLNSNNNLINNNNNNNNININSTLKKEKPPILKPKPRNLINYSTVHYETPKSILNGTNGVINITNLSSSPSTSVTDISTSNICTPQHFDNDKYPIIQSRTNSLIRSKQKPPVPLPTTTITTTTSQTSTFNRYITNNNEINSNNVNYVNTLRRQNIVRNTDC